MHYRNLGSTGMRVSAISFAAWTIGGTWGTVSDEESMSSCIERWSWQEASHI